MSQNSKKQRKDLHRPLWTPYYQRVVRNKKKYTRKDKHKKNWKDWD